MENKFIKKYFQYKVFSFLSLAFLCIPFLVNAQSNPILWTKTSNPGNNEGSLVEKVKGIAVDSTGVYITGSDYSLGLDQWRIEKRDPLNGNLVSSFGISGVIAEDPPRDPMRADTESNAIAVNSSALYVAGHDVASYSTSWRWRIEKRNKTDGRFFDGSDGAHSPVFGTGGIIAEDLSAYNNSIYSIAVDSTGIYLIGNQSFSTSNTNSRWRIEKRDLTTGSLISGFGTGGVVVGAWDTFPTYAKEIKIDVVNTDIYVIGTKSSRWWLEKRDSASGSLISSFGTGGVLSGVIPPYLFDVAFNQSDPSQLYLSGYNGYIFGGNSQWRIEKRDLTTGSLISGFGTGGVVESSLSSSWKNAETLSVDNSGIYRRF